MISLGTADSHPRGAARSPARTLVTATCAGIDTRVHDRGHWTGEQCRPASHLRHRPWCREPGGASSSCSARRAPRSPISAASSSSTVHSHRSGPPPSGGFPATGITTARATNSRCGQTRAATWRPRWPSCARGATTAPARRRRTVAATATGGGRSNSNGSGRCRPAGRPGSPPGGRARAGQLDEGRGGVLRARRRLGAAIRTPGSDRLHALPEVADILASQPGRRAAVRAGPGAGIGSHLIGARTSGPLSVEFGPAWQAANHSAGTPTASRLPAPICPQPLASPQPLPPPTL